MTKKPLRVSVRGLKEHEIAALDAHAKKHAGTRNHFILRAIREYLRNYRLA